MKTKKIVVLLILVLGISYYIHDTYYAKKNLAAPNTSLDLSGDTNEKKSYNSNIKPFNTIKTRIFGESKYAVQKLLGKPNKVLSSQCILY